jgi:oligopeptide/dipeptide ABC transporter ATP-binding protein
MTLQPVLSVENLHAHIPTAAGTIRAVNGISFRIWPGKVLGLMGESGCGKSITCLSVLGLLNGAGKIIKGKIRLKDRDILGLPTEELRKLRGNEISMIMQNPMSSFDPIVSIGQQFIETIRNHKKVTKREAITTALECLQQVELPCPEDLFNRYPFQMSGGMLQRVMIAIAIASNPAVLIADEPTTALDVTVQQRILGQLVKVQEKYNTGILLVSHDLKVIAQMADEVAVMYCGYIVEKGPAMKIFDHPLHPYTRALLASRPGLQKTRLKPIKGQPPALIDLEDRCPFFERCDEANKACLEYKVYLTRYAPDHFVSCLKYASKQEVVLYELA